LAGPNRLRCAQAECALQFERFPDSRPIELTHPSLKCSNGFVRQRLLGSDATAALDPERSVAVGGITRQSLLADLYEYRSQVTQLVCTRAWLRSLQRSVCRKCLQVFAADLGGGPNPVAQFPHNLGKRVEGRAARLSRQMGTAQLIADPLQVCLQLSFPTHLFFLLSSNWCASFHIASGNRSQLAQASVCLSISSGRTRSHPVR